MSIKCIFCKKFQESMGFKCMVNEFLISFRKFCSGSRTFTVIQLDAGAYDEASLHKIVDSTTHNIIVEFSFNAKTPTCHGHQCAVNLLRT